MEGCERSTSTHVGLRNGCMLEGNMDIWWAHMMDGIAACSSMQWRRVRRQADVSNKYFLHFMSRPV